jgi:membrane-bound toxin of toxin-antitoxin system
MTSTLSNFELPIRFPLTPSRWLIAVIYLSHSGALACIYLSNIPAFPLQLVSIIVLISLAYCHYEMIYKLKKNPVELLLNDKDEWYIIDEMRDEKEGEMMPAVLLPESFVHARLIVLMFKEGKRKRAVILTPDNISEAICRRLRVRLRFALYAEEH